ncbi:hypothetical protein BZA70DRAFT_280669 [Myxozyma melibiosi]|uniref:Ribosomal lysine N-methyltransferase 5 n=1 Tax=Myxozyma melibiosi TaxID=54550 RepID=A0ABR1F5J7_9ASCO
MTINDLREDTRLDRLSSADISEHVFTLYSEHKPPDLQNLGYFSRTLSLLPVELRVVPQLFVDAGRDANEKEEEGEVDGLTAEQKKRRRNRKVRGHNTTTTADEVTLEYVLHQSLELFNSQKENSTTGAVLWQVSPLFAEWVLTPGTPFHSLFRADESVQPRVIEIGAGVGGILACALSIPMFVASAVAEGNSQLQTRRSGGLYVATDQAHILPFLRKNIASNLPVTQEAVAHAMHSGSKPLPSFNSLTLPAAHPPPDAKSHAHTPHKHPKHKSTPPPDLDASSKTIAHPSIEVLELDWEHADADVRYIKDVLSVSEFDVVVACDTIYNDFLIAPFVRTLRLLASARTHVLVGMQMRAHEVVEAFLDEVMEVGGFDVWVVRPEFLSEKMRDGFVIYYLRRAGDNS